MTYKKIPISVEAEFMSDGFLIPRTVLFETERYPIDRIVRKGKYHPPGVSCIAPIEYVVMINGHMKFIYFEPSALQWFTVKEITEPFLS